MDESNEPRLPLLQRLLTLRVALLAGSVVAAIGIVGLILAGAGDSEPPPSQARVVDEPPALPPASLALGDQIGDTLADIDPHRIGLTFVWTDGALKPTPTPTPPPPPPPTSTPEPAAPPPAAPPVNPAPPPPAPPPPSGCQQAGMNGFAVALFNAINSARAQNGRAALSANACVVYVSQLRAYEMAGLGAITHDPPSGSAFAALDRHGIGYGWAGENLARNNYPDGESVSVAIRDLMNSPPHRENILNGNFTQLGVGATTDGAGMKYYVMIFIGPP